MRVSDRANAGVCHLEYNRLPLHGSLIHIRVATLSNCTHVEEVGLAPTPRHQPLP